MSSSTLKRTRDLYFQLDNNLVGAQELACKLALAESECDTMRTENAAWREWAEDINTYLTAACAAVCAAVCAEMEARPAITILNGPLYKALSSGDGVSICRLLESYAAMVEE